jgi:hypothetical protein
VGGGAGSHWTREYCLDPAISHIFLHVSLVQWTNLFASRHKGHRFKSPGGYLCETGILLLAMSRNNILFTAHTRTCIVTLCTPLHFADAQHVKYQCRCQKRLQKYLKTFLNADNGICMRMSKVHLKHSEEVKNSLSIRRHMSSPWDND